MYVLSHVLPTAVYVLSHVLPTAVYVLSHVLLTAVSYVLRCDSIVGGVHYHLGNSMLAWGR